MRGVGLIAGFSLLLVGCATPPAQPVSSMTPVASSTGASLPDPSRYATIPPALPPSSTGVGQGYEPARATSLPSSPSPAAYPMAPSSGAYTGNCLYPDDLDTAGRRCGARSAYSRPGGYEPTYQPSYSYSPSSSGSVGVRGYYRRDGTYVRPHSRRR